MNLTLIIVVVLIGLALGLILMRMLIAMFTVVSNFLCFKEVSGYEF